ncbi:hypothetical protein IGI04_014644 [Brassica rapa subsp. trilocularis]|uniref:Uncharacterized protein n=1 Tax=Brassica rapa subsp. trilocularis TaxID=1813537 RepID=A0ABQ7MMR6_BRACM|nr:hypothetical protein IGI04_014644 [Brassica rapa subsp. trilocularis]
MVKTWVSNRLRPNGLSARFVVDRYTDALSYKGAVELQPKENHPEGEARRQYHQTTGKHDYKGKGVASERERNASLARGGPGRRSREQERAVPKYVRQAGYLPPKELQDSYLMATDGINGLRNQDVGNHLDDNQKLMLDAFKSGGTKEMSGTKTRKALQFEEEPSVEMNQEDEGKTQVEAKGCGGSMEISVETVENTSDEVQGLKNTVETSDLNVSLESQVPKPSEEKLEIHEVELGSGVEGGSLEMVAGLGNEDGNLEYVMSEEGEEEDQEEFSLEDTNTDDTEMVMADARVLEKGPQTDVVGELTEEKGRQKKKSGKLQAAATGGNAKKRTVQCFASPRKKVMAKHFSKVGEKGPAPKKALAKTKPDQVVLSRSQKVCFGVSLFVSETGVLWYEFPVIKCMSWLIGSGGVDKSVRTRENGTSGECLVVCSDIEMSVIQVTQLVRDGSMITNRGLLSLLPVRLGNGVLIVEQ